MKKIIIFGATSAIAIEVAKIYSNQVEEILLAARNEEKLKSIKADLETRGNAKIEYMVQDANDSNSLKDFIPRALEKLQSFDLLFVAHGTLPQQTKIENDYTTISKEIQTNFLSVVDLTTQAADYLEKQGKGTIAVISSVAGDRGRQSNYVYGSAKGAVSLFLQGLRNRLTPKGVHVCTIKPGFVDTPMTADVPKNKLFASPDAVAKGIVNAIKKQKDVVYLPFIWKFIMTIIRNIPEGIFKKMKL